MSKYSERCKNIRRNHLFSSQVPYSFIFGCCDVSLEVSSRFRSESCTNRTLSCHTRCHLPRQSLPDSSALCVPSLALCVHREGCPFSYSRTGIRAILHSKVNIHLIVFINNSGGQFDVTSPCRGQCKSHSHLLSSWWTLFLFPALIDLFILILCNLSYQFMPL